MPGDDDGYEYVLGLRDDVSGPTGSATRSLDNLTRSLARAEAARERFAAAGNVSSYRKAAREAEAYRSAIDQLPPALSREARAEIEAATATHRRMLAEQSAARESARAAELAVKSGHRYHEIGSGISYSVRGVDDLARGGRYAASGLVDLGMAAGRLGPIMIGGAVVAGLAVSAALMVKLGLSAAEAKREAVETFDVMGGHGAQTFRALEDLAANIHAPAEKVQGLAKELMAVGLTDQAQLLQTVRAITEMRRVGLDEGANRVRSIIERSVAAGHLVLGRGGAGASRALAGTGISEAGLAAALGFNPKSLEAQLKAGKITVEQGIQAIDSAIVGGKVGALATKKFGLSDAFTDLKHSFVRLFEDVNDRPLLDAVQHLVEAFEDGTDGATTLRDVTSNLLDFLAGGVDDIAKFGEAWGDMWRGAHDAVEKTYEFMIRHNPLTSDAYKAKKLHDIHVGLQLLNIDEQQARQNKARERLQAMANSGASQHDLAKMAKRLGVEATLVDRPTSDKQLPGFRAEVAQYGNMAAHDAPLHDMRSPVHAAAKKLGADTFDGIDKGYRERGQVHSPSRVMFELGQDSFDGLEEGAERARAESDTRGGSERGVTVHVDVGGIKIEGASAGESWMPLLESQIADIFERVALELGS